MIVMGDVSLTLTTFWVNFSRQQIGDNFSYISQKTGFEKNKSKESHLED